MAELLAETMNLAGSMGLRVEVSPRLEEIDALLRQIPKAMQDFSPAFRRISAEVLLPSIRSAFAARRSQDGEPWAPLSKEYAKRKGSTEVGVKSGKMRAAATEGGSGSTRRFGKKVARIGTSLGYSVAFQYGYGTKSASVTRAMRSGSTLRRSRVGTKRSAVSPRPFVAWNDAMRNEATDIMVAELSALVAKATGAEVGG